MEPTAIDDHDVSEGESFARVGHGAVDWIAGYLRDVERYPVLSRSLPGDVAAALPSGPPAGPTPLAELLADFEQIVLPGITHWNHPGFMAYFGTSATPAGILAEMLAAALNVNGMLWRTSPSATELEQVVLDWLRQMLGLPPTFTGIIADTASMSTFLAVVAARDAALPDTRRQGLAGRGGIAALVAYASAEAHSSVEKAVIAAGVGSDNLRKVPTDEAYRMRPDELSRLVAEDLGAGRRPFLCVATVGTTSTTSIDPVGALADISARHGLWLHVDGAYGAAAAILPERRDVLDGCERADSLVVNPHKWLMTPMDCSALYLRHPDALRRAFSLVPDYLRTAEGQAGQVVDFMDYGLQLGRRFRALKLWFVIRENGVDGLARHVRGHCRLAQTLAGWVDAAPDWERLAPVPLSTVCLRYVGPRDEPTGLPSGGEAAGLDELNERILARVNVGGEVMLSHTRLRGHFAIRVAIGNAGTEERHVARAWEQLRAAAESELELEKR